ncbi:hypothetical protein [Streptomyces atratus]|uniref:hypothetical protein n=1 Tax=Streptomyces atratus TaxID=1893 RepID=UPI0033E7E887
MIGRQHFGAGARFFVPWLQLTSDGHQSVNQAARDRHPQGQFFAGPAVDDLQPEGVVEPPLDLFRDQCKVHIEVRERIQQSRGVGGICRLIRRSQVSQLLGELFALCAQRGVLPADRITEPLLLIRTEIVSLVAAEAVGEGADEAGLALADGTDGALQRSPLLGNAVAGIIRGPSGFDCGCEVAAPIGAEDPCGEAVSMGGLDVC